MKVRWQVYDGYAGGGRPQSTEIDDEELSFLENEHEREEYIEERIEEDFREKVTWIRLD